MIRTWYHSASKTQIADRIFKLNPFHASVNFRFPDFDKFSEFLIHLGKTPLNPFCISVKWAHILVDIVFIFLLNPFLCFTHFSVCSLHAMRWHFYLFQVSLTFIIIVGSKWGGPGTRPLGSKFFHFHVVFGKKNWKIIALLGVGAPPWGKAWIRHWLALYVRWDTVEEEHRILTWNGWMFSLPHFHFQFKSVNISNILTFKVKIRVPL